MILVEGGLAGGNLSAEMSSVGCEDSSGLVEVVVVVGAEG